MTCIGERDLRRGVKFLCGGVFLSIKRVLFCGGTPLGREALGTMFTCSIFRFKFLFFEFIYVIPHVGLKLVYPKNYIT